MAANKNHSLSEWRGTAFVTDATWGDNGKGKVVDLMAQRADVVVRTNGGPNAGHTVKNDGGEFKFHLMPSGIFNKKAISILAGTVVIDPFILQDEIEQLRKANIDIGPSNLLIADNAHLIMPWHRIRDGLREKTRGNAKIGTTGRGIGPVYADRAERVGLQMRDLLAPQFEKLFDEELQLQEKIIRAYGAKPDIDRDSTLRKLIEACKILSPLITQVLPVIWEKHAEGKNILGEAGQGVLLDLDLGTYPYVTSSHPGLAGFNLATGLSPFEVNAVVAVTKAYTTRVGAGPMPTELNDKVGEHIRTIGGEFGTTTGRPRRCGWLDIPAIRFGLRAGGATALAITKLDIFDDFFEIKICVGYEIDGVKHVIAPNASPQTLFQARPIYETLPGWKKSTVAIRKFNDLPKNAQTFVLRIEELIDQPIPFVSVGPHREQSIFR